MKTTEEFIDNHLDELLKGEDLREKFDAYIGHPVTRFVEGEVYQDSKGNTLEIESIIEDIYLNRIAAVVFNNKHFTKNIQQHQDVEFIRLDNPDIIFYAK